MAEATEHLCVSCSLSRACPKAGRFQEVQELCESYLDEIVSAIEARPKDTEYAQYTLSVVCGATVVDCPYYSQQLLH